jgi:N-acyl-D-amino-acid deacylase
MLAVARRNNKEVGIPVNRLRVLLLLAVLAVQVSSFGADAKYDVLLLNGLVYDGAGAPPRRVDIAILQGRIVEIGALAHERAARRIDAKGMAVAPGFIDLHAHLEPLLQLPGCESAVRQGVTTALGGPDGGGPSPFGVYLTELEKMPLGMNVGFLVGQGAIRRRVMKLVDRDPTAEEMEVMKQHVAEAMREGAFGLSTGLKYLPGAFSKTEEIIALAQVAAQAHGIYTSHLREEGAGLIPAVEEAIAIGRRAGIPVVLTHHKVVGKPQWGASVRTLKLVDAARAAGLDVMFDQYPYTASNAVIAILIPSWAQAGGREEFRARMANPVQRAKAHAEIVHAILTDRGAGDVSRVQFAAVPWKRDLEGKTLSDWCLERGLAPTPENGADLVIEAESNGGARCIYHAMDDADLERIMRHPQTMIASDGRLEQPGVDHPHPRCYGTFPRVLARYVREKKLLTLESAIHKMSGMPAQRLGLSDRGRIAAGMRADIVVFDPATVTDEATFNDPHQYPSGIPFVFVNGVPVVEEGKFTAARAGQVLRRPAATARANVQ